MTAFLISLAVAGLLAVAYGRQMRMSAEIIQFNRGAKPIARQYGFRRSSRWITWIRRLASDAPGRTFRCRDTSSEYVDGRASMSGQIGLKTMPRDVTEIRSLARSYTRTALNVLVGVMRNTKAHADGAGRRRQRCSGSRLGQGYPGDREPR